MTTAAPEAAAPPDTSGGEYRSLLDRLAVLAEHLPVSHIIDHTPVGRALGALIAYAEHGVDILDAADADADHVAQQLLPGVHSSQRTLPTGVTGVITAPYPEAPSPADSTSEQYAEREAQRDQQIADLQAQIQRMAAAQHAAQTTVDVQPVSPSDPGPVLDDEATQPTQPSTEA